MEMLESSLDLQEARDLNTLLKNNNAYE
jgi:hypothetical protein